MPAKPTKYGIKVWMRADPTNGFCNDFTVYTGKDAGRVEHGLSHHVVTSLTQGISGFHHIVNCDNFFSSPALFDDLARDATYARGTVRVNWKGMPSETLMKSGFKAQGEMKIAQKDAMIAVRWRDKRITNFLSTADSANDVTEVKRRKKDGSTVMVPAHAVISEYNKNMNGVDLADQLRNSYPTFRKARKWWTYVFWFLFDVAVCNGYIMMRESVNHEMKTKGGKVKQRTLLSFKMALAKALIGSFRCVRKRSLPPSCDPQGNSHLPVKGKASRCPECAHNGQRSTPSSRCIACGVALCIKCFVPYHKRMQRA